jgi:hypothetical protein
MLKEELLEVVVIIVIDIETTGLYPSPPGTNAIPDYIVAIGILDEYGINVISSPYPEFSFAGSAGLPNIERDIIRRFCDYFDNILENEFFVTYNGASFDIPFIATKLMPDNPEKANQLLSFRNIDLMEYSKFITGRRISKDDACRKLANLYVPRKTEGLWSARIYKNTSLLTENDHMDMLQHNAIDLASTARLFNVVKEFPDYHKWLSEYDKHVSHA